MFRLNKILTPIILFIASHLNYASADCANLPEWTKQPPIGSNHDYYVGLGEAANQPDAHKLAIKDALMKISVSGSSWVETKQGSEEQEILKRTLKRDKASEDITEESEYLARVVQEVVVRGQSKIIPGVKEYQTDVAICRYGDKTIYKVAVLLQLPRKEEREVPRPVDAFWRSLIAPSWGQFYKGHTGRAAFIIVGEALTLSTSIIAGVMSKNDRNKADSSSKLSDRDFYNDRADKLYYISLVAGIASGVIYLYNVLDASFSPRSDVIYASIEGGLRPLNKRLCFDGTTFQLKF